jgi:hypothetical protein
MSEPTEKSTKDMGSWAGAATLAGGDRIGRAGRRAAVCQPPQGAQGRIHRQPRSRPRNRLTFKNLLQ